MLSLLALAAAALLLFVGDGRLPPCGRAATCEPALNVAGFVGGSIVGVVLFGLFMVADNTRRATKRYRDLWFKPRKTVAWITVGAWALGMLHMYGLALHLTRLI